MVKTQKWRALIRNLRRRFPIDGRITVTRCSCKKWCGICRTDGAGNFRIRINSSLDWSGQVDALLHEWAHVLAIEAAYKHDRQWGEFYTEIYRTWEDNFGR